jgi:hypothetical protein
MHLKADINYGKLWNCPSILAFVLLTVCFMQTNQIQQCSKVLVTLFLVVRSLTKWNCWPCHTLHSFFGSQCGTPGSLGFVVEKVAGFSPSILVFLHTHSSSGAGTVDLFETAVPKGPFLTRLQKKKGTDS